MISVCIVDNEQSYHDSLVSFLQKAVDISLLCTGTPLTAMAEVVRRAPDIVLLDIKPNKESGFEFIQQLKDILPSVQVIVLTAAEDEDAIFGALKAGAAGYLLKKDLPETILQAIRTVHGGEGALNGTVVRKVLAHFQQPVKLNTNLEAYHLTHREKEILFLLLDGLAYKEIAARCFISVDTINSHIRKIYSKLNVRSRAEIAARFR